MTQPQQEHGSNSRTIFWCVVFGLNLIVPVILSQYVCKGIYANGGMIAGIVMCGGVTLFLVRCYRTLGRSLCIGGIFLAFTQFVPVIQVITGMIALGIWERVAGKRGGFSLGDDPATQFFGGLFVTFQTAQILLLLSLVIGYCLNKFIDSVNDKIEEPKDDDSFAEDGE